jgi:NtrC-family two-component system sensor histidine kinase KinB
VQIMLSDSHPQAAAKRLDISCSVEPELPPVMVDRQRIEHVFQNILSNAIKHSPPGSEILVRAEKTREGNVRFSIRDQGPGIPEEYQNRVFDRLFRVPGQAKTGAGLGLFIAHEIVSAHDGQIGVESQPGHGSEFFVILEGSPGLPRPDDEQSVSHPA